MRGESLYLHLLGKIHSVAAHSLIESLFGTPVDSKLLVAVLIREVIHLILREGLLLYGGEVAAERFNIYSHILCLMENDCHKPVCMCNAYMNGVVLNKGAAVVVMSKIDLIFKDCVKQCAYCQFLSAARTALCKKEFVKFFVGYGDDAKKFLFRFGNLPDGYFRAIVKLFSAV